jgi:putative transposase
MEASDIRRLREILERSFKAGGKTKLSRLFQAFLSECSCELSATGAETYSYAYQPNRLRDDAIIISLSGLVERYPRYGFPKLFQMLTRKVHAQNHKRVHRVYCKMGLNISSKEKSVYRIGIHSHSRCHCLPTLVRRLSS